ncbi:hypothetical protein, partial [Xanthovirga aplysinae]|uniref:hypothetical protein n=1 Tax=Xanthovirga aplysinae TaxID=2529853 RepID=UPI001CA3FE75
MKKIFTLILMFWAVRAYTQNTLHTGDTYIQGSLAIGTATENGESFGFDTFRMKEDNLRIHFQDMSTAGGYPSNDWRITINDSENGGKNYFRIDDATRNTQPFKILAGSRTNALVTKSKFIGIGTDNPAVLLHTVFGNTPTLRLEQDGSSGWSPYAWDVAANEINFFVRDVKTNQLPFRIAPSQGENVLTLKSNNVGIGTWNPKAKLHVNGHLRLNPLDEAPETPGLGDLFFDKSDSTFRAYNGILWQVLNSNTDNQDLFLENHNLSIENGNTVDLSVFLDNTDAQTLSLNENTLSIENGNSIDLSEFKDNTDRQNLTAATLNGTTLEI